MKALVISCLTHLKTLVIPRLFIPKTPTYVPGIPENFNICPFHATNNDVTECNGRLDKPVVPAVKRICYVSQIIATHDIGHAWAVGEQLHRSVGQCEEKSSGGCLPHAQAWTAGHKLNLLKLDI